MISWFARNHVAANLLLMTILFLGGYSVVKQLPLEVFPRFDPDVVTVSVVLRGATPEEVEQSVAIRIEEALLDLEGIEKVISRSTEGMTTVTLEIDDDYSPRELQADIKSRVDAINTFPVEAEKPVVSLQQWRQRVIAVTVSGEYGDREVREYVERVRDDLLRLPEISQVDLTAVPNFEIGIDVSQDQLREYGLTLTQIGQAITNSSLDLTAGNIRAEGGEVLIRSKGQAYRRNEFEQIVVKTNPDGSILRLGDVARVNDGFEEVPIRTRFNGEPAAMIEIFRVGNQSAIEVADAVHDYIDKVQAELPESINISYWDDDSEIVKNRLSTLTRSAIQGGILVLLLLTLFLRPAIAFWVFIGVPVSFMGAFFVMNLMGLSINIVSLFGFILVLGIVVDDAIVTGENVYRHMRGSETGLQAAINGTKEVAVPVTFGVLTTIAAFIPMAFIEGFRGAIFGQITLVVIPVLIFSLIESKFVLPAHLKHVRLPHDGGVRNRLEEWQQRFANRFEQIILKRYRPLLKLCLRHSWSVLALFIGTFILLMSMVTSGWTHFTFFPRVPSETARATLTMPAGTAYEVTDRYINHMLASARTLQDKYRDEETGKSIIINILGVTGAEGEVTNTGNVMFEVEPPEDRELPIETTDLVNEWRDLIGPIPGAESLLFRAEIGRGGAPIDVQLTGRSLPQLGEVVEEIRERLGQYPGVFDIEDSLTSGKEELQLELTPQGHALGLTRADVIRQVRQAFFGLEVQRIQRGRDDVRVMLRLPLEERKSLADLEEILINTATGSVPLAHVATLTPGRSPSAIYRIDHYRTVNVRADIDKESVNMLVLQQDLTAFLDDLLQSYPGVRYQLEGEAREQQETFGSLAWGLLFTLFVVYSLLAIPFKSYTQPFIVMSVIPFGFIGAMVGHWIMGMNLTIMSIMGLMALLGVVVNDSLVLVDFINQRRRSKVGLLKSILLAGTVRFRPVMLTSATTFIGLMPLLFEKSTQAQFLIPMAVSLGFGILFATLITLIMVPINYLLLARAKLWMDEKRGRGEQAGVLDH
ncbi:MAG: efflux RND transporter permease subunit [Pseudomonadales bacterium]